MAGRILIVDDEPHNLDILRIFLSSLNYDIHEATCGMEALKMIDQEEIDLILLDVMMPDISGFDICKSLYEQDDFHTPVIFLSAKAQKEDILFGLQVGALDYLTKPFDLDLLEKKVNIALENRRKLAELRKSNEMLQAMAYKDQLTGLYNRHYLQHVTLNTVEKLNRFHSIMMIDMDNFKYINDRYGHLVGDRVLTEVSHIIQKNVHDSKDVTFRYGGDEFLILLHEHIDYAKEVAELIREAVSVYAFSQNIEITLSVGLAATTEEKAMCELLEGADTALFNAKSWGRNRVSIYQ